METPLHGQRRGRADNKDTRSSSAIKRIKTLKDVEARFPKWLELPRDVRAYMLSTNTVLTIDEIDTICRLTTEADPKFQEEWDRIWDLIFIDRYGRDEWLEARKQLNITDNDTETAKVLLRAQRLYVYAIDRMKNGYTNIIKIWSGEIYEEVSEYIELIRDTTCPWDGWYVFELQSGDFDLMEERCAIIEECLGDWVDTYDEERATYNSFDGPVYWGHISWDIEESEYGRVVIRNIFYHLMHLLDVKISGDYTIVRRGNPLSDPESWREYRHPVTEVGRHVSLDSVQCQPRSRRRRGGHVSRRKAHAILRHDKVHGKPLTDKQRQYFGWLATKSEIMGLGERAFIAGASMLNDAFRERVITLLNTKEKRQTEQAIMMLRDRYARVVSDLYVTFDACNNKKAADNYLPYKTGSANSKHIRLCDDARTKQFAEDYPGSKTIAHDPNHVSHYAVIVLHEFGHVLDKNDLLERVVSLLRPNDTYGDTPQTVADMDNEERADLFAEWFLGGSRAIT